MTNLIKILIYRISSTLNVIQYSEDFFSKNTENHSF